MKLSFLLAGLLLNSLVSLAQKPAPVGIQLYSFRDQFAKDVPGTMAKVKQMGFREAEIAGTYGMSLGDFRKLLDQNGIKAVSTGASFEDLDSNVPKVLAEAKALGAKYVVCTWIPHAGDKFMIHDADRAIDVFNTAGKLLAENGISLCYHNHGYEFQTYQDGTFFDYLAENLDRKVVNFEMDVFWVKSPGYDPVALLQKYPKRFVLMHLKDRKPGTPDSQTGHSDIESNVTLGQGDVGIAALMKQAKKSGVKHFFIEDESSRSMEQVPQSVAFLEGLK
ncbi:MULTISPECIES: sugar phosphate isomerase/epimerase [unclassified Spirosoma]|uniref:sugar phosphate isomerase/epimerase family protein n=1 Tax=unclassified Spirosoma TaxID=2621999 RepID=UPI0009657A32|nr:MULTISPECIES: sugar phosphate isomerase/epimerase [unclassified Spirosoma]MBN8825771.1 sugar phosphate isomerase/epimerase [Spirosoma sp.]OJW74366.1 MAG: sugar phosphate isomerase [Spirosoma sp. 48-14]